MENYYKILEINPGASKTQIRKAYLRLAKKYHPDKNHQKTGAEEQFKKIQQAYDILVNSLDKQANTPQNQTQEPISSSINWAEAFRNQQHKFRNIKEEKQRQQRSWFISFGFIAVLAIFATLGIQFSNWWFLVLAMILVGALITGIILHYKKSSKR